MEKAAKSVILAIETGIGGGSISVLEQGIETGFRIGDGKVSRSEDILSTVANLLAESNIEKQHITEIVTSQDVGSLTGLRIGLATVLGLKNAWRVNYRIVSLFESMSVLAGENIRFVAVFPVGRNNCEWTLVEERGANSNRETGTIDVFKIYAENNSSELFIVHQKLFEHITVIDADRCINAGENLAYYLGKKNYTDSVTESANETKNT